MTWLHVDLIMIRLFFLNNFCHLPNVCIYDWINMTINLAWNLHVYLISKKKIIKTKLISQRVTVNTDTEYFLHDPVHMLDPPLNVSREIKTRDLCDVIVNILLRSTVFVNCRTNSGKEMTSYVSKSSVFLRKLMCCLL